MGSWCVYLYWTLACTAGLLRSYARVQTDEYKSKHLPYFTTAEDGNEKQLVSAALRLSRHIAGVSRIEALISSSFADQRLIRCSGKTSEQSNPSSSKEARIFADGTDLVSALLVF